MFQMRQEHVLAFQEMVASQFEERTLAHLRYTLREWTDSFDDGEVRARIRMLIPRAARYGLTAERQTTCYIDTSYLLGPDFDIDPDLPEAKEILICADPAEDRAFALLEYAMIVAGEEDAGG